MTVVSIKGEPIPEPGKPVPELVEHLEKLLERARSGEVTGVAYAVLYRDDLTSFCPVGRIRRSLLGALTMLQYALCKEDYDAT